MFTNLLSYRAAQARAFDVVKAEDLVEHLSWGNLAPQIIQ